MPNALQPVIRPAHRPLAENLPLTRASAFPTPQTPPPPTFGSLHDIGPQWISLDVSKQLKVTRKTKGDTGKTKGDTGKTKGDTGKTKGDANVRVTFSFSGGGGNEVYPRVMRRA